MVEDNSKYTFYIDASSNIISYLFVHLLLHPSSKQLLNIDFKISRSQNSIKYHIDNTYSFNGITLHQMLHYRPRQHRSFMGIIFMQIIV